MNYRQLGNTGIKVSEIGFGAWGIGGKSENSMGYGEVDDKKSIKTLKYAYDQGVTLYDTADLYGEGHSEKVIAKAFKGLRDKIILASKGGTLPHTGLYMPQDFSAKHIVKALDHSLKRLETDYIDIYQMHSPKISDLEKNDIIEVLEKFKNQGKIREYGISVRSPDDGIIAIKKFNMPCIQVNYNLIDQRAKDSGLFKLAKLKGTGIIARTPLGFGFLTGKLSGSLKFSEKDHRLNYPKKQLFIWANSPKLFSFLYKDKTVTQASLRFCLDYDAISTVIPGMIKIDEVKENLLSSIIPSFSDSEHKQISEIYKKHVFFDSNLKGKKDKKL